MKVLNFGSLNLDDVYQVEHFVQPGETLSAMSQTVNPGGKGLNQSIALAKAGAEVSHAGCLGLGGEALGELLRKNGVDTTAAGDTFTGYFVAGLMEGRSLQDCMRLSSMASAIGVTRAGAANSIPEREEVEKALEGRA